MADPAAKPREIPSNGFNAAFKSMEDRKLETKLRAVKLDGQNIPDKLPQAPKELAVPDPTGKPFVPKSKGISVRTTSIQLDADVKINVKSQRGPIFGMQRFNLSVPSSIEKGFRGAKRSLDMITTSIDEGAPMHPISGGLPKVPAFTEGMEEAPSQQNAWIEKTKEKSYEVSSDLKESIEKAVQAQLDEQLQARIRELEEENRGLVRTVARQQREIDGLKK